MALINIDDEIYERILKHVEKNGVTYASAKQFVSLAAQGVLDREEKKDEPKE